MAYGEWAHLLQSPSSYYFVMLHRRGHPPRFSTCRMNISDCRSRPVRDREGASASRINTVLVIPLNFRLFRLRQPSGVPPGRRSDSSSDFDDDDDDGKRNKIVQKMVPNSSINKAILPTLFPGANVRLARRQFTFSTGLFFFSVAVFFATTLPRRRRRPRSTFEDPGWSLVFVFSGRVTASDRRRRSCRCVQGIELFDISW